MPRKGIPATPHALVAIALAAVLSSGPALADPVQDKTDCLNYRLEAPKRGEACGRVLAGGGLSDAEKAEAYYRRGYAYAQQKSYDLALADYNQAIALNGANGDYYGSRATAYRLKRDFVKCVADYTKSIELKLDKSYTYMLRGECHYLMKKFDDAIADFDQVLKLDPKNMHTLYLRGFTNAQTGKTDLALADFDTYLAASPFHAATMLARGKLYAKKGDTARAITDLRMAVLLNANLVDDAEALQELAPVAKLAPPAQPVPLALAPVKSRFTYIQTEAKDVPPKDEMEEAIGGLVAWFRRPPLPEATRASRFEMTVDAIEGGNVFVSTKRLAAFPAVNTPVEQQVLLHQGMWPRVWPGPGGMHLLIGYDGPVLDKLWPLKIGQKAQGDARVALPQCPPTPNLRDVLACPADQLMNMGITKWKTEVVRWEQIVVPAGRFDAMVIRHQDDMELSFMGRSMKRSTVAHYWYAPALKWWVRRTTQADGQIQTVELVAAE